MADSIATFKTCIQNNFGDFPKSTEVNSQEKLTEIENMTSENIRSLIDCLPPSLKDETDIYDYVRVHAARILLASPIGLGHPNSERWDDDNAKLPLIKDKIRQAAALPSPSKILLYTFLSALMGASMGCTVEGYLISTGTNILGRQIKLFGFFGLLVGAALGTIDYIYARQFVSSKTEGIFNQSTSGIFENIGNWELSKEGLINELVAVVSDYEGLPPEE